MPRTLSEMAAPTCSVTLDKLTPLRNSQKKFKATFTIADKKTGEVLRTATTKFGWAPAEDYTLHKDKKRRKRYIQRHEKDLAATGDPTRAGFLSMYILWGESTSRKKNEEIFRAKLEKANETGLWDKKIRGTSLRGTMRLQMAETVCRRSRKSKAKKGKEKGKGKRRQGKRSKINPKYLPSSLSPEDTKKQREQLKKSQRAYREAKKSGDYSKLKTRKKVKSYRSKESRHVRKAKKIYGIKSMSNLDALSKATGCSKGGMEKILKKGRAAYYSSGSRPNQTAESWARARLASAVTAGKAADVDKGELREAGCYDRIMRMRLRPRA